MFPAHVKWKRVGNHELPMPCRKTEGAAGFDLLSAASRFLGDLYQKIPTGWAVEIPAGFVGVLVGRSGLAIDGITCHPGTIDSDYRGEVNVLLRASIGTHGSYCSVRPGERIAQLLIVPCLMAESVEAATLTETARGEGGFGSTGR